MAFMPFSSLCMSAYVCVCVCVWVSGLNKYVWCIRLPFLCSVSPLHCFFPSFKLSRGRWLLWCIWSLSYSNGCNIYALVWVLIAIVMFVAAGAGDAERRTMLRMMGGGGVPGLRCLGANGWLGAADAGFKWWCFIIMMVMIVGPVMIIGQLL